MGLANNCSKHILAELKADHVRRNSRASSVEHREQLLSMLDPPAWSQEELSRIVAAVSDEAAHQRQPILPIAVDHAASVANQLQILDQRAEDVIAPPRVSRKRGRSVQDCIHDFMALDAASAELQQAGKKRRGVNGWTLHLKKTWESTFRGPRESKASRRNRVLDIAKSTWRVTWFCLGFFLSFFFSFFPSFLFLSFFLWISMFFSLQQSHFKHRHYESHIMSMNHE